MLLLLMILHLFLLLLLVLLIVAISSSPQFPLNDYAPVDVPDPDVYRVPRSQPGHPSFDRGGGEVLQSQAVERAGHRGQVGVKEAEVPAGVLGRNCSYVQG